MAKDRPIQKVCFAASSGGHLEQLMMLKPLMDKYQGFIVTEKTSYDYDLGIRTYKLMQVNRKERSFIFRLIGNAFKSLRIYIKERPDAVISTGVLACVPLCLIGKLFGSKLIFIESFAKTQSASMTGHLMYRFADCFYVQWESMLEVYPNARYIGGVY